MAAATIVVNMTSVTSLTAERVTMTTEDGINTRAQPLTNHSLKA